MKYQVSTLRINMDTEGERKAPLALMRLLENLQVIVDYAVTVDTRSHSMRIEVWTKK